MQRIELTDDSAACVCADGWEHEIIIWPIGMVTQTHKAHREKEEDWERQIRQSSEQIGHECGQNVFLLIHTFHHIYYVPQLKLYGKAKM